MSLNAYAAGTVVTLVGFGSTNTWLDNSGTKRKANSYITATYPAYYQFIGNSGWTGDTCFGDSGGPAFRTLGGVERVIAVTHGGLTSQCGQGSASASAKTAGAIGLRIHRAAGRDVFVDGWRNFQQPLDINNDGLVSPIDALMIINRLNSGLPNLLPVVNDTGFFLDPNGDGYVTPLDVLLVINHLNAR